MKRSAFATMFLILIAAIPGRAPGRDGISRWLSNPGGVKKIEADFGMEHSPRRAVKDQEGGLELWEYESGFYIPLIQDEDEEWSLTGVFGLREVSTGAVLPDSGSPFPKELWDVNLGFLHSRILPGRRVLGLNLSLSSPSDQPFAGWDEMAVMLNGFLKVPAAGRDHWLFFLNYSSNREFLPHVPIPGAGYLFTPSRDFTALAGIPLLFIYWRPVSRLSLRAYYFPIHSISSVAEMELLPGLAVFTGFRWVNDRYYRADRKDKNDRLFWYEKRLESGIEFRRLKNFRLVLTGGYSFDRFFFEGEGYEDRLDNRVEAAGCPFLGFRLSGGF